MFQNDFIITLPSNSSVKHFPNNTTTNFSTYLPRELDLTGRWSVGLCEIHIPCTILHVRREEAVINEGESGHCYFQHGIYDSVENLVNAINLTWARNFGANFCVKLFSGKECAGYVVIGELIEGAEISSGEKQALTCFRPQLSKPVDRILGLDAGIAIVHKRYDIDNYKIFGFGKHPASLARAIPDQLYVYSNICEPGIVGDTSAPLLRIVNVEAKNFNFGSTIVKKFNPVSYVPLLNSRFQVIDIDIRDQFGAPIAFESGTLTVTLHFRREL